MLLHIAYKAEQGMDLRNENGIAKGFSRIWSIRWSIPHCSCTAHWATVTTHPLARWYTGIRSQRLVDGPDEVHRWRTGANVIKAFERDGSTAAACGGDLFE